MERAIKGQDDSTGVASGTANVVTLVRKIRKVYLKK